MEIIISVISGAIIAGSQLCYYSLFGKVYRFTKFMNQIFTFNQNTSLPWVISLLAGFTLSMQSISFLTSSSSGLEISNMFYNSIDFANVNILVLLFGTFLVGVGTKIGKGCFIDHTINIYTNTYGSISSMAVILLFYTLFHPIKSMLFQYSLVAININPKFMDFYKYALNFGVFSLQAFLLVYITEKFNSLKDLTVSIFHGLIIGCGMTLSFVFGNIKITPRIEMSLLEQNFYLLITFLMISFLSSYSFKIISKRYPKPLLNDSYKSVCRLYNVPCYIGNAIFGIGWALSGISPLTGVFYSLKEPISLLYIPAMLFGFCSANRLKQRIYSILRIKTVKTQ